MNKFDWKEADYPCLGKDINGEEIVCFSSYGTGHLPR